MNEFATHSKTKDDEIWRDTVYKKGPRYHNEKVRLAKEQNIDLHFIWEDDFVNSQYKTIIRQILKL